MSFTGTTSPGMLAGAGWTWCGCGAGAG